jgi:hypothetical protein
VESQTEEELLKEADRLASEVEAELAKGKFDDIGSMEELPELTPEMMENMDPALLQEFLARMAQQRLGHERREQAYYTRKQTNKAGRKKKRLVQKKARRISTINGSGKSIPHVRRRKNAA